MNESPREIVLSLIEQSANGLTSADLRKKALALDGKQVSNAIYFLKTEGHIEAMESGNGAPMIYRAVKAANIKKGALTGVEYCADCKQLPHHCKCKREEHPGEHPSLIAIGELESRLKQPQKQVANPALKTQVLNRLAAILHPDVAAVLDEIVEDITQ